MNATRDDIYACFRLLLGRQPNTEEVAGHFGFVGHPLHSVVSSYLQSLEFRNRGLLRSSDDVELITLDRFRIYVAADDGLIAPGIRSGYEPEVTAALLKHVHPGDCVVDIGANCGYFSLLSSSLGATVYAFEPLQRNVRLLAASRILNGFNDLHLIAAAASDRPKTLTIGASYTNGIVGVIPTSAESALSADYVPAVRIDDCIPEDRHIGFIKIDVEGHEYAALLGSKETIKRSRPVIISEFSPSGLEANSGVSGRDYLDLLSSFAYRLSVVGNPDANTADAILRCSEGKDHIDVIAEP